MKIGPTLTWNISGSDETFHCQKNYWKYLCNEVLYFVVKDNILGHIYDIN